MRQILLLITLLLFTAGPSVAQVPNRTIAPPVQLHSRWVDSVYYTLSLNERIAQLLMIPAYSNRDRAHTEEVIRLIRQHGIGSVLFFQGGPGRQLAMAEQFQQESKVPLLMAIDGEWGLFMRLDSVPRLPRQMLLGAIQNDSILYEMGRFVAEQCRRVGLHINFAPAVDVNSNRNNPVIGTRSFGENPQRVSQLAIAYMKGMQDGGIFTSAKHFPGHGDTETDSHLTLPVVYRTRAELDSVELTPFRAMISAGVSGIMSAHLFVPAIDNQSKTPTSLSAKAIESLLRQELQFQGLIYTDALNMKGASEAFRSGELEVRAFEAGNDILVMPDKIPEAISAIREAILSGRIDSSRLEASCRRILAAKEMAGLASREPLSGQNLHTDLNGIDAALLQHKIMENAITVLTNRNRVIPITGLENKRIALVLAGTDKPNFFVKRVADYCKTDLFFLPEKESEQKTVLEKLQSYDLIIGGVHNTNSLPAKNFGVPASTIAFFDRLATRKPLVLSLFGCPYAWSGSKAASQYEALVIAYEESEMAHDKTAQILFGAMGAKGRLPVSINDSLRYGMGIDTQGNLRLAYVLPESIGIDSNSLTKIDSLVEAAIAAKAMPGCQVMAAKEGKVFFRKNYGDTRYSGGEPVTDSTLYDLASVTKIAATVVSAMKLYETRKLPLDKGIVTFLPELQGTNKARLTLRELLTHQAGLEAFIPFYQRTIEPINPEEKLFSSRRTQQYSIPLSGSVFGNSATRYVEGWYATSASGQFPNQVADNLFISRYGRDSLYRIIDESPVKHRGRYLYSDLGSYYLMRIIEKEEATSLPDYAALNFYNKLGCETLGFNPLKRFPEKQIAPTADDSFFRRQLLQGYVHDEGAAMMGGVAGHAGLFGNANDLAKVMQMLLNKGTYGGDRLLAPETVNLFTACQYCRVNGNRRGLGFDKPDPDPRKKGPVPIEAVSTTSFGHSGFTGPLVWADPQSGLLYIFITNRVHPDPQNNTLTGLSTRTLILEQLSAVVKDL